MLLESCYVPYSVDELFIFTININKFLNYTLNHERKLKSKLNGENEKRICRKNEVN